MKLNPFIEAEKTAGHSVQKTCALFEVSTSAFYARRKGTPSARQLSDAELLCQISVIHKESKGTYGAPRIHKELLHRHVAVGKRKVTRLMRAAGLEGRCKKRWCKTTVADPDAEAGPRSDPTPLRAVRRDGPALCRRHHLHLDLGGLGLPGHRHRSGLSPRRRLGPGRSHAHRAGRRRPHHGVRQPGTTTAASSFIPTAAGQGGFNWSSQHLVKEVCMGRQPGWMVTQTGRPAMRSPGRPPVPRDVERAFWLKIAAGLTSEDAAIALRRVRSGRVTVVPRAWGHAFDKR